jgi:hypothetical protein
MQIPPHGALSKTAEIEIDRDREEVFRYVSANNTLPAWLKKCGLVNGVTGTTINHGPYSFVGASRTVYFDDQSTLVETLTEYNPYQYYSYSVTNITDKLKSLISIGYGQWWFSDKGSSTQVKWVYSFVPKNFFARIGLSLFMAFFYARFMKQSLQLLKTQLELVDSIPSNPITP